MRKLILLLPLMLLACNSPKSDSDQVVVSGIKVLGVGIFKIKKRSELAAEDVASGKFVKAEQIELVKSTTQIRKSKGIQFGVRFIVEGSPARKNIPVTIRLQHPPIKNVKTGKMSTLSEFQAHYNIGQTHHVGYGQSDSNSLPVGKYVLSLIYQNRTLLTQQFNVQ